MNRIKINVTEPAIEVNIPISFDLVQPDSAMIVISERIPKKRAKPPIIEEAFRFVRDTSRGKPSVVIIITFVIANRETRKKLAARTEAFMIVRDKRVLVSETKRFAITAIEKPPSNELIAII